VYGELKKQSGDIEKEAQPSGSGMKSTGRVRHVKTDGPRLVGGLRQPGAEQSNKLASPDLAISGLLLLMGTWLA
jgi:hypothetical protein